MNDHDDDDHDGADTGLVREPRMRVHVRIDRADGGTTDHAEEFTAEALGDEAFARLVERLGGVILTPVPDQQDDAPGSEFMFGGKP